MREGQASRTAVLVCQGRAFAHGRIAVGRFADPTAFELLPEESRARVERARQPPAPDADWRARLDRRLLAGHAAMMATRTVAIDDAIREAASEAERTGQALQLVILGAGLDGRAWRMPELAAADVFEVDHPDSQRDKRERAAHLTPLARSIHYVPVDFARDSLDQALAAAGHDPTRPTMWVWEGVVMYLDLAAIEATLAVIDSRSAAGSRLAVLYHSPAPARALLGLFLRRIGEPLRSRFTPPQMASLLSTHHLSITSDLPLPTIATTLSIVTPSLRYASHLHLALASHP